MQLLHILTIEPVQLPRFWHPGFLQGAVVHAPQPAEAAIAVLGPDGLEFVQDEVPGPAEVDALEPDEVFVVVRVVARARLGNGGGGGGR